MLLHTRTPIQGHGPAAILPLPAEVISQVKSSTTITSLAGVVLGLLENSLDAGATSVEITIDSSRGGCIVEDNGGGILPSEFRSDGCLGRMYHTSKRNDESQAEHHGDTGTFLASLAAMSLLTITSHHHLHHSHNTLVLHHAKPSLRLTPAPLQHQIHNSTHGTRVIVRDLFGNMPVRVKQRALTAGEQCEVERRWEAMKRGVVSLLLPWPAPVAVKVSDVDFPSRGLNIRTFVRAAGSVQRGNGYGDVRSDSSIFDASRVPSILTQAGLASNQMKDSWVPASASTLSMSVTGLISLEPAPSRAVQFISIGASPCSSETGYHELYDTINRIFSQSNYGRLENASGYGGAEKDRRKHDRRYKLYSTTKGLRSGGVKGVDRWPKFFFRVDLRSDTLQANEHSTHSFQLMIEVIGALVTQWLEANGFRPRKRTRRNHDSQADLPVTGPDVIPSASLPSHTSQQSVQSRPSGVQGIQTRHQSQASSSSQPRMAHTGKSLPSGRAFTGIGRGSSIVLPQTPFTEWSRIKSGRTASYSDLWNHKIPTSRSASSVSPCNTLAEVEIQSFPANSMSIMASSKTPVSPVVFHEGTSRDSSKFNGLSSEGRAFGPGLGWIDSDQAKCRTNARDGKMSTTQWPTSVDGDGASPRPASLDTQLPPAGKRMKMRCVNDTRDGQDASPWLQSVFGDWKNPIFPPQREQVIDVAASNGPRVEAEAGHRCGDDDLAHSFLQAGHGSIAQLSKTSLPAATVISQVDDKFILLKLPSGSCPRFERGDDTAPLLVLVDQHAASERCILEGLLVELCSSNTDNLRLESNIGHTSAVQTIRLNKPLHYQVSTCESRMFRAIGARFAHWGILYDIVDDEQLDGLQCRLTVIAAPPGIAERGQMEPKHFIELLRSEVYSLAEARPSASQTTDLPACPDDSHDWLRRMGSCPKGLLSMLNSRACRSAIMFNDRLSIMECRELIQSLAKCAFPFMCAHGRVSMVPVLQLGINGNGQAAVGDAVLEYSGAVENKPSYVEAFRKWRSKKSDL